ncbi:MAG: hypothetical protein R3C45_01925 [Phycisphaerales bacterium]
MQRHKAFAPVAALILLIVLAMLIAQCDVRYATADPAQPIGAKP